MTPNEPAAARGPGPIRPLAAAWLIGVAVLAGLLAIPVSRAWVQERLAVFLHAIERMQFWGPILVGALFIPVALLILPGSPVTLFGGFAFGRTAAGFAIVCASISVGSTLGAALAFLVARKLGRRHFTTRCVRQASLGALNAAVSRAGFRVVLLSRLSPLLPYNLLNYLLGLSSVSWRDYVLGTWLGMLPGTIMYVYLGATLGSVAEVLAGRVQNRNPARELLFYAGLAATGAVVFLLSRGARKAWREQVGMPGDSGTGSNATPDGHS